MYTKQLLPAFAALASVATAQNNPCSGDTITINSNADLKNFATCSTLTGNVVIGENSDTSMDFTTLSSLAKIDGDFTVLNNRAISSLKAPFSTITGAFHLQNLTKLSTLSMPSLKSVGSINFVSLNALGSLTFTTGVTTAKTVVVSDTFLSSLDGLDMVSCASMDINNNKFLTQWDSKLGNLTDNLNINANGLNFKASFPNMIWISNMTISNVSSFDVPSLSVVNGSMRFDSNFFESFSAPNLTDTDSGDISFVSNSKLTNITMPSLTSVGGGFLIANNTNLHTVTGFPQLKSIGGAAKFRGNFSDIEIPKLDDVKGAFDLLSTDDVKKSCDGFSKIAPQSNGGNGGIQGTYSCEGNNANANSDTSGNTSGSGGSSGNNNNGAAGVSVNNLVLGLAAVGALFATVL